MIDEVTITFLLEFRIQVFTKLIATVFKTLMKMLPIIFKQTIRSQIRSSSKPAIQYLSVLIIYLEISEVSMYSRHHGAERMNDQGDAAGKELLPFYFQLLADQRSDLAMYLG